MGIMIGSARADENYKYSGGRRGDQRQKSSYDTSGEVSLQSFYEHSKGWYILRPKKVAHANAIAKAMEDACNNKHFGYSQSDRYSVLDCKSTKNADIKKDVNCDCSSLVRKCILDGTGTLVKDFATSGEASVLEDSGLFEKRQAYTSGTKLYNGDVLVTKTTGHTVIVVSGNPRSTKTTATSTSTSTSTSTGNVSYIIGKKYTVKTNLNMRKQPDSSTDKNIIMVLSPGDKMTCKQVKKVSGATWISNGAGWACGITSSGKVYIG